MPTWPAGVPPTITEGSPTIDTAMPRMSKADDLYPTVAPPGYFNLHLADVEYGTLDGLIDHAMHRAQLHIYEDFVCSLQAWNIAPPRFSAMTVIAHNPNPKLTGLASVLGVAHSGVVLLVNTPEDMGMVERQPPPKDKRVFRFVLIAKGATILDETTRVATAYDARMTAHLSADERQMLLVLLNKLVSGPDSTP